MEVSAKAKKFRDCVTSLFFMRDWKQATDIQKKLKAAKIKPADITPELIREAQRWDDYETRRLIGIANGHATRINNPQQTPTPKGVGRKVSNGNYGQARKIPAQKKPHVDINPPTPNDALGTLSVSATCRWMGAEGWSVEQAEEVFAKLEIPVSLATIVTQLRYGTRGNKVPKITMLQEMKLNRLLP